MAHFPTTGKVGKVVKSRLQEAGTTKAGKAFEAFWSVRVVTVDGTQFCDLTKKASKAPDGIAVGALVALEELVSTENGEAIQFFSLLD